MNAASAGVAATAKSRPAAMSPVMPTYARADVVFERGEGAYLYATDGRRFLDFTCGIAVTALGHAHPHLVKALTEQAQKLWHTSNLFRIAGQERLAERLVACTFADTMFFGNSGAEAVECTIKLVRKYHAAKGHPERHRIITFEGAFHGRTLATLAAGGQKKYLEGFGPVVAGFDQVPFGDVKAVEAVIGPETAAIMIEPVQGEGGVRVATPETLRALREICDRHGLLLVLDEVQTGIGRSGRLFAYEWAGITPDVMAVAKGLGGGFPVGAILATEAVAAAMTPGTHGSTFGGNPLAMAVAGAVLDVVLEPGFLEAVQHKALRMKQMLASLHDRFPDTVAEVRGQGLLTGLRLAPSVTPPELVKAALAEKLLLVGAGDNVVRVLPPLTADDAEIAEAGERLARALAAVSRRS